MNRREFLWKSLAGLAATSAPGVLGRAGAADTPAAASRPNILLLMADQHRADCIGAAGNPVIRTPNLDGLAREGARFRHAYSCTPTCTPARAALLTGLNPWHNGMLGYGQVGERYAAELPRCFSEAGFEAVGIGKMHWHPQRNLHGFHRTILDASDRVQSPGFVSDYHRWFHERAPGLNPDATGLDWNDYRGRPYALPEELHPTHWIAQTAIDFLGRHDGKNPFFLKVSFERPHSPYDPPKRFWEAYREDDMPPPVFGAWDAVHAIHWKHPQPAIWQGDLSLAEVRRSRRGYYGSVSFVDEQIGRVLGALEKRGWLENTFIIFISDHGDMLGDHHLWRKSYAYESSARIQFIVRPPKDFRGARGQVLDQTVELRDVLPTLVAAAGLPVPSGLDGQSVLPLLHGQTAGWRPWIDLEHNICYSPTNHYNGLTDGRIKYIYQAQKGHEQLFDLENDPDESNDLAAEPRHGELKAEWRKRLVAHLAERGAPFVVNGDLAPRPGGMLYSPHYPRSVKLQPGDMGTPCPLSFYSSNSA
jgi:arylsulfatase